MGWMENSVEAKQGDGPVKVEVIGSGRASTGNRPRRHSNRWNLQSRELKDLCSCSRVVAKYLALSNMTSGLTRGSG